MEKTSDADRLKSAQARKLLLIIAKYDLQAFKRLYQDLGIKREGEGDLAELFEAIGHIQVPDYPQLDREVNENNYLEIKAELMAPGSTRRYRRRARRDQG